MKVIAAAIGSGGDLLPMVAVGVEFQRRGHNVVVLAGSWQEEIVRGAGLCFESVLTQEDFDRFTASARATPVPGGAWVAFFYDAVMPAVERVYAYVAKRAVRGETLLLGSSHALGLRLASESLGLPLVTTRLQPQPAAAEDASEDQIKTFNGLFAPMWNRMRGRHGLAPIDRPFDRWLVSLDCAVAFFPPWFPDPRVDSSEQGKMMDFLLFDTEEEAHSSREMDVLLASEEAPIIFTHGTGNDSASNFFQIASDTCQRLDKPAIFLTRYRHTLPAQLPKHVLHASYFPFEQLLPYAQAIVYHGGIGTCAQALRAGTPQLVIPVGFDQYQNAERVECLGAGFHLDQQGLSATTLTSRLAELLSNATILKRCQELAQRFTDAHPVIRCCDAIEELAHAGVREHPG